MLFCVYFHAHVTLHTRTHCIQVFHGFSTSFHLTDTKNRKCLQSLVDRDLSPQLVELYGPVNVQLLSLLRAQLYTTLAQCLSPLHHTPVVR